MKFASSCAAAWLSLFAVLPSSYIPTTNAAYIDDATALKRFFEVSDGPRWINSTNWMSDASVCTWFGIVCDPSSQRVTEIMLPGNNLVGRIAKLLYQMESLTSITLKDNAIRDADFPGFAEAAGKGGESKLQNLDLAGNSLSTLAGIGGAPTTLTHLHLTENNLKGPLPLELFNLTNIQNVFLSFNQLTGTLPTEIGKLEFLESLYLYGNDLTGTIPTEIGLLTTVKILTLAENRITGSLPSQVADMINLQTFSVHNHIMKKGKLTGQLPSFEKSPFLSEIKLDGNAIEGEIPSKLLENSNDTSSLVTIGLSENLLTGSLPTSLLKFTSLYLDVTGNQITEVDPKFCHQGAWMSGLVEELGCDALLCPENTWNVDGRATQDLNCTECASSSFFGATVCETVPVPLMQDWVALAKLYQALDGPHWNNTQGWTELDALLDTSNWEDMNATSLNVCLWHGIDCESGESVKGIVLKNNGLVGTLPTEIFSMTELKVLDMSLNTIQTDETLGLSAIINAKSLSQLDLSGTKIVNIQGIDTAPAVTSLYLDGLELPKGPLPNELLAMTRLEYLHLQYSGLTGTLPTEIGALNQLKSLYLFNNNIGGQLPSELGLLTALTELDLSENNFSGALPADLDGMTSMERLFIRQTGGKLSGSLPAFNKFPNLLELSLDDNKLTGSISPDFLSGIQNKSQDISVSLANNQVKGTIPKELDVFDALTILLEGNEISGIAPELCDNSNWMFGMVGALGNSCDAILCPPGTFNTYGKRGSSGYSVCADCSNATYYGTVKCDDFEFNGERLLLDTLFHATGGAQWKRSTNWTEVGVPICYREGIICLGGDVDSGVLEIELSDNGLTSDVPADILNLPKLKLLALSDNQIDLSWERASAAKNLVTLKLSNTNLRSLTGIGQTSATLTELHISGNQLTGAIPSEIYKLSNLKQLYMDNNLFTGSIASMIGQMVNLEQFHGASNMLTGNIPTELGALSSLEQLDLELNYLSGNLPISFDNLTGLNKLSLKGQKGKTKLSGPIISFSSTTALSTLDLSGNDFSGTIPDDFLANVPQSASISVNLRQNRIGGTLPTSLATRFTQLSIDLADNAIIRLFDDTCDNNDWMSGKVADYSCDAILCSPGFAATDGKQVSSTTPCMQCPGSLLDAPFFGSTECKAHIFGNSTERNILLKLYEILNGTSWEAQTYWNSDMDHCTWYGIVCNSYGVSEFNMEANGLEAGPEASSWIFSLPHLEKLDLKGNNVPLDLTKIPSDSKLRVLMLSSTGLQSTTGISNAKGIRRLHLSDNELMGTFPKELFELTELRTLYLSFNSFNGTLPTHLSKFSHMEQFYAFGNMFSGTLPGNAIAKMTNLREFILANNFLEGEIPHVFNSMSSLEQLSLYGQLSPSMLNGTVPTLLNSPKVWYFDASDNDLTGTIPVDFMKNSLYHNDSVSVYLSNNELTGTLPSELAAFTTLDLVIVGNRITGLPSEFCGKTQWMQNRVGLIGSCDAIACPPGTYTLTGRQEAISTPCQSCSNLNDDNRYGVTNCENTLGEKAALLKFYEDTGGSSWKSRLKWASSEPICSWEGILCENGNPDDDSGVTGIWLEENNLSGTMPAETWQLPFLNSLNLKNNTKLHVNFEGLSSATKLEILYLSGVRIDNLVGLSQAQNVREIHFTECGISGPFPSELFSLASTLEGVFIAYNSFSGTLPAQIGELTNLESFYAYDNEFSGHIPTEIGLMRNLNNFVVSDNLISGSIPTEVTTLGNLQLFSVFRVFKPGPKLSGPLPPFNKHPKLTDLYLEGNALTGSIPNDFLRGSARAHLVTLSHNSLVGGVPASLDSIDRLNLQLEGNQITAFPASFCNNTAWMDGAIKDVGCPGFLCPVGSASLMGRANATVQCNKCPNSDGAIYFGSVSCSSPVDERQILVLFFQKCGGSDWYDSFGWASSDPHCNWHGIVCKNDHVVEIKLGSNNLVGIPPPEIFSLPELHTLELYANPIEFKFDNISLATNLATLRLDSTGLKSVGGISKAPALRFIDLRFNNLEGQLDKEFGAIRQLRYLSAGNNKFSGTLSGDLFSDLKYLKSLRLGNNGFTGKVPTFEANVALTFIDLSDNKLTGTIPPNFFGKKTTTTPTTVDLSGNKLTGWVPGELDRFKDMNIYLRNNQISELPLILCDNGDWNDGDVESYGCNGILCPPNTFNLVGRERDNEPCQGCLDGSPYWGQVTCSNPSSAIVFRCSLSFVAWILATALIL